jgi:hypothetical protein
MRFTTSPTNQATRRNRQLSIESLTARLLLAADMFSPPCDMATDVRIAIAPLPTPHPIPTRDVDPIGIAPLPTPHPIPTRDIDPIGIEPNPSPHPNPIDRIGFNPVPSPLPAPIVDMAATDIAVRDLTEGTMSIVDGSF